MSNSFDFELVADDQVSEVIDRINDALRDLEPKLNKTKEGLQLGGQETLDGLNGYNSRLELMARSARDNVQLIGDMVPPLKMVGEISGKLGALGVAGAAGYGLKQVAYGFREASREAYNLDVSTKNAGMRVEEFSRLAGAMQINGSDSESARASIEGFAKALKEANSGSNQGMMAAFSTIGVQIQKNKDGSVDTLKTLQEIARVFPTLRPEQQKSFADAVGFTPEMLALMREGERMKSLLAKSDEFGLTIDPELNQQLGDINGTMNELSASWDGLWQRSKNKALTALLSDGSVKDGLEGVTDLFTNGDFTGLSHALGFVSSDNAKKLRRIQGDKELYTSLSRSERGAVDGGFYTDAVRKRYDANYGATDSAIQLQADVLAINGPQTGAARGNVPYGQAKNNSRGFRNHNPGNLREASNSTGKSGGFSTFATDEDGLSAMAKQLMLYGDRGNNTVNGIIHTYAPSSENNTRAYIDSVSESTGFGAQQRINLHDPETLKSIMAAMIKHENGAQPYSQDTLKSAIQTAITDDKWSGKRNSDVLAQQRYDILSGEKGREREPSILARQQGKGDDSSLSENLARSLKEAMSDQTLKLEITMVNDKGERKTYNVANNGRITTPMNY
ncbi:hypothetical protein [Salmonella enterica]|uniref:hypothetical protein n=1 Tax=Salmonella enterica TaxID=28901 RepID=UPI0009B0915C|nr:hypothetical protein [Salmonella enterica subsp. diarizonae]EKS3673740.1 hypothetical protein [Salmonella enterica]ELW6563413.1 hypothetical protein [Salmonella enterica]ELZ1404430.1 hypothetical protein [Salmonella enterica]WGI48080.1 hypothetical protein QBX66_15930 [Salmonella enterica subsp. diarizonae serovar 48:i:z]